MILCSLQIIDSPFRNCKSRQVLEIEWCATHFKYLLESIHRNSKNEATYWCSGFASDKFEKILGAGHAQQEISLYKPWLHFLN